MYAREILIVRNDLNGSVCQTNAVTVPHPHWEYICYKVDSERTLTNLRDHPSPFIMLLLLLFAYLAHNATQALTIPHERENPLYTRLDNQYFDDRTIWSIIWSCLTTLFACSWVAMHPNVPSGNDSNARIQGRRLAMMGYMLLAPECVILWAAMQYFSAKEIEVKHQLEGLQPTTFYQVFC